MDSVCSITLDHSLLNPCGQWNCCWLIASPRVPDLAVTFDASDTSMKNEAHFGLIGPKIDCATG
jgi:hypothetical protein